MAGVFNRACFVADDVPGLRSDDAFDRAQRSGVENEICLGGAWQKMDVGVWPANLVAQKFSQLRRKGGRCRSLEMFRRLLLREQRGWLGYSHDCSRC